jgi:O-acetyl-ADP-ribose deacetylase (regulator of RNase III)
MKVIKGDLITAACKGDVDVLVHGANCRKLMGSGIAGAIAKRIPQLTSVDLEDHRDSVGRLGRWSTCIVTHERKLTLPDDPEPTKDVFLDKPFIGVNLYTQLNPGAQFYHPVFEEGLRRLAEIHRSKIIGMPMIGGGIGGGNWEQILNTMVKIEKNTGSNFVLYLL